MLCVIWYHLLNLKIQLNTNGGVLKSQVKACTNDTKPRKASHIKIRKMGKQI